MTSACCKKALLSFVDKWCPRPSKSSTLDAQRMKKKGDHRPRNSAQYQRVVELLIMHKAKTDTETNFVVTVGFTTKVDHQTTSKITLDDHEEKALKIEPANEKKLPARALEISEAVQYM